MKKIFAITVITPDPPYNAAVQDRLFLSEETAQAVWDELSLEDEQEAYFVEKTADENGELKTSREIAVAPEFDECYEDDRDGDPESALASAGFGTDEDYGSF